MNAIEEAIEKAVSEATKSIFNRPNISLEGVERVNDDLVTALTALFKKGEVEAGVRENMIYVIASTDSGSPDSTIALGTLAKMARDRIAALQASLKEDV